MSQSNNGSGVVCVLSAGRGGEVVHAHHAHRGEGRLYMPTTPAGLGVVHAHHIKDLGHISSGNAVFVGFTAALP